MNNKYYAVCELNKDGNINHVFVDTISSDYEDVKYIYYNVKFDCIPNNFTTLCEANNRHKRKYGYYKYGITEIDINKINPNKYPNYEQNNYLYVMDYCQCAIFEIKLYSTKDDDIERLLKEYGLDVDTCNYMYSKEKLNIETINKK